MLHSDTYIKIETVETTSDNNDPKIKVKIVLVRNIMHISNNTPFLTSTRFFSYKHRLTLVQKLFSFKRLETSMRFYEK